MLLKQLVDSLTLIGYQTQLNFYYLSWILGVLWTLFLLNEISKRSLLILGLMPRTIHGLLGIFCSPLLHANFNHLFFNSIPLVVLANFLLMNGLAYFIKVTFLITLISGGLIWLFGRSGLYIGASAVITGYWSLLVYNIWGNSANLTNIILGLISLYFFAGIFLGIFPKEKNVSWEGHLFGLLAGIIVGYYFY